MNKKERQAALELLKKRNVVAVGFGKKKVQGLTTEKPAMVVSVKKKVPLEALAKEDIVPATINGQATDVVEVGGEITLRRVRPSLVKTEAYRIPSYTKRDITFRERPAHPGCSIGHYNITAGTFGAVVYCNKTNRPMILSNNHVLANVNKGKIGDSILQPGAYDGGREPDDVIALLKDFVKIEMVGSSSCPITKAYAKLGNFLSGIFDRHSKVYSRRDITNTVDCALAEPLMSDYVDPFIPDIGVVTGIAEPTVGMEVMKRGRTTELTRGKIDSVDNMVNVNMGDGEIAIFEGQIIISGAGGKFSAGGDSGSLILNKGRCAVGLLFAGNDSITIGNDISNVIEALDIRFMR